MPADSIVVLGGSAGAIEALRQFAAALPAGLPAALAVVIHTGTHSSNLLPRILSRSGPLEAAIPEDGEAVMPARIAVAPGGSHLTINSGRYHLSSGPRENGHRPAIDPLFRSAARAYGPRALAVLFSGADDDGTEGLLIIKAQGGLALVQDPETAVFDRMPRSAIEQIQVDAVLPPRALAEKVRSLAGSLPAAPAPGTSGSVVVAEEDPEAPIRRFGEEIADWEQGHGSDAATGISCPLCGGGLWFTPEEKLPRFRCHTGHAFSPDSLVREHGELLESTLWHSLRILRERSALYRRLAENAGGGLAMGSEERYLEQANEIDRGVDLLRDLLQKTDGRGDDD
jgi:two-component system, chemotaxis family, protein-glutamate methylesterase/glutaminase